MDSLAVIHPGIEGENGGAGGNWRRTILVVAAEYWHYTSVVTRVGSSSVVMGSSPLIGGFPAVCFGPWSTPAVYRHPLK